MRAVSTNPPDPIAVCIGCGCDDLHACLIALPLEEGIERSLLGLPVKSTRAMTFADRGCSWLRLDRGAGLGVCSACPGSVERWDAGDRDLDDLSLLKP
jgi:hypothetical protein